MEEKFKTKLLALKVAVEALLDDAETADGAGQNVAGNYTVVPSRINEETGSHVPQVNCMEAGTTLASPGFPGFRRW